MYFFTHAMIHRAFIINTLRLLPKLLCFVCTFLQTIFQKVCWVKGEGWQIYIFYCPLISCAKLNQQWTHPTSIICVSKVWYVTLLWAVDRRCVKNRSVSHTAALGDMFPHEESNGYCRSFFNETSTNNSVQCIAHVTVHVLACVTYHNFFSLLYYIFLKENWYKTLWYVA